MEQNLHYINDIDISEYDAMEDAQIQPEQHSCVLSEVDIETIVANLNDWN